MCLSYFPWTRPTSHPKLLLFQPPPRPGDWSHRLVNSQDWKEVLLIAGHAIPFDGSQWPHGPLGFSEKPRVVVSGKKPIRSSMCLRKGCSGWGCEFYCGMTDQKVSRMIEHDNSLGWKLRNILAPSIPWLGFCEKNPWCGWKKVPNESSPKGWWKMMNPMGSQFVKKKHPTETKSKSRALQLNPLHMGLAP